MPACRECEWFVDGDVPNCSLTKIEPFVDWHDLDKGEQKRVDRACKHALTRRTSERLSGDVLEIGPGVRNLRRMVNGAGAVWHGLEPRWGNPDDNLTQGTVADMPYFDERFDWVIAFECIEHWHEHGDDVIDGLAEIHRVLKPGGTAWITCPFYYHGHPLFFEGHEASVRELFANKWSEVVFEEWRKDHAPLPPLEPWTTQAGHHGLLRRRPSAWRLEVQARK